MDDEEIEINMEDILYEFCCSLAKNAGIQELLENYEEALSMYNLAKFVLDFLRSPSQVAPVSSLLSEIPPIDPENVTNFTLSSDKVQDRLLRIQSKVS